MECFIPRALYLALLARVTVLWKKTSLGCQMHCSTVDTEMTWNTIVAKLRSACWAALLRSGSSPLLHPHGQALKLGSQSPFSPSVKFIMLETTDLGVGTRCSKMTLKINITPEEMCQKELETSLQRLSCYQKGSWVWAGYLFQKLIQWSGRPLVNQPFASA